MRKRYKPPAVNHNMPSHYLLPPITSRPSTEIPPSPPTTHGVSPSAPRSFIISPGITTTMTERMGGRNEKPEKPQDFFGKNRHHRGEASAKLKKLSRSELGDDYDDSAAASCPTSRKRQRSRSRDRVKTGLWGDGQDQLPGRNGMGTGCVASHRSSPPLEPLPETPRSCSFTAAPLTLPSPPSKSAGEGGDAGSDRLSLIEQEDVARELGHRMAFLSWRGYDESFLRLMDEVVYDDADDDEKNDAHFPCHDEYAAVDVDARATGRVSSSDGGEGGDSEACYVPCDPVADRVPVLVAMDEGVDDKTKNPS